MFEKIEYYTRIISWVMTQKQLNMIENIYLSTCICSIIIGGILVILYETKIHIFGFNIEQQGYFLILFGSLFLFLSFFIFTTNTYITYYRKQTVN